MRQLRRLSQPAILTRKGALWREKFCASQKTRPDSRQYAHREIRETLRAMSHHKCFYCETKVDATNEEVDHYLEVGATSELAFAWENLYLSCARCNSVKRSDAQISVAECLDPCGATDPAEHLTFEDEVVVARNDSTLGLKTIGKYALDRPDLNYLRLRELQRFNRLLIQLYERCRGRSLTAAEREILKRFAQSDHAYSLMFQIYLDTVAL